MPIAEKIAALIEAVKREGFDSMPPAHRRHLAQICRFIADKADPDRSLPTKTGVLAEALRPFADCYRQNGSPPATMTTMITCMFPAADLARAAELVPASPEAVAALEEQCRAIGCSRPA